MIKILSSLAAPVCQSAGLSSEAQGLVTSQQTPAQYVSTLENNGLQRDATKFMVYGMSEKDAVCYAAKSAQKAVDPANLADQEAIKAAQAWMKTPGEVTQKAATEAAGKADLSTPGAWAAQAAAWAQTPPGGAAVPGAPNLTQHAAFGAIQLAAASPSARAQALTQMAQARAEAAARTLAEEVAVPGVPAVPQVQVPAVTAPAVPAVPAVEEMTALARSKTAGAFQPYCEIGKGIANGTCTC